MRGTVHKAEILVRISIACIFLTTSFIPSPYAAKVFVDQLKAKRAESSEIVLQPPTLLAESEPVYYDSPFNENPLLRTSPLADDPVPNLPPGQVKKAVEFTLEASPSVVGGDGLTTLTATIRNNSTEELVDLTYTDKLEDGFAYISASWGPVTYDSGSKTVSALIPKIGVGEEADFRAVLAAGYNHT